jgi:hypothetical protein
VQKIGILSLALTVIGGSVSQLVTRTTSFHPAVSRNSIVRVPTQLDAHTRSATQIAAVRCLNSINTHIVKALRYKLLCNTNSRPVNNAKKGVRRLRRSILIQNAGAAQTRATDLYYFAIVVRKSFRVQGFLCISTGLKDTCEGYTYRDRGAFVSLKIRRRLEKGCAALIDLRSFLLCTLAVLRVSERVRERDHVLARTDPFERSTFAL